MLNMTPAKATHTVSCANALQMVIHGISQVLKPNLQAPAVPSEPRTALAEPTAPAASTSTGAGPKGASGRKVLQFRSGTGPSVVSNSLTATQSSIRAAVAGNANVEDATAVGEASALAATRRCWNCIVNSDRLG